MSVLIEALCLVIPNRVLDVAYPGGATAFVDEVSMRADVRYAVTDGTLSAVSMFDPSPGIELADGLEAHGIVGADERQVVEFAFVDMHTGSTLPCAWLETAHHPHGFMIAWGADGDPGRTVVPGDWDPSRSWRLERTDLRDDPEHGMVLASEDGFTTLLDLKSGHVSEALDTLSPVVPVGREQPESPEDWELVTGLSTSMQSVQEVLQRTGIPFQFDRIAAAIRIPFDCDVTLNDGTGTPVSQAIRQRVLVSAGPAANDITCSALLPVCVPVHMRSEFVKIAELTNRLSEGLRVDFDANTGTVAISTFAFANGRPLDAMSAERAVANVSPVGGKCYEELVEWLEERTEWRMVAVNFSSNEPSS